MDIGNSRPLRRPDDDGEAPGGLAGVLSSKPALFSVAAFFGACILWFTEPEKGTLQAALKPYAPAAMSLTGSFIAGFLVGRVARRKLKPVLIAGVIVVVAISLLAKFGVIGPAADQWVHSTVGWVSEGLDKVNGYVAALLPSVAAASGGLYMGFRGKRKSGEPRKGLRRK